MSDDGDFMHEDAEMEDDLEDDEVDDDDDDDMNDEDTPEQEPAREEEDAIVRRRAIQAIMRDNSIGDQEKRMRIQSLMSGGRCRVVPPPAPVLPQSSGSNTCVHYERNCNIVAPCCGLTFGCRICHDEMSPQDHPPMNRFLVREVVCKLCHTRQAAS